MDALLRAVHDYFDARNQAWVTGNLETLRAFAAGEDARRSAWQALALRQRALGAHGIRIGRAHTRLKVLDVRAGDRDTAAVLAREQVWWVHREDGAEWVEGRIIHHWQRWQLHRGWWRLLEHRETDERMPSPLPAEVVRDDAPSEQSRIRSDAKATRVHMGTDADQPTRPAGGERDGSGSAAAAAEVWWPRQHGSRYDRVRAMRYAELWWDGYNPAFERFADDCTNFISQCLLAGGMRMTGGQSRDTGWWYRFATAGRPAAWSYSWSVSHALYLYLTQRAGAQRVASAQALRVGDLVFYDWDGSGRFHHSTIVVDFDLRGDPLVNAHTDASYHRPYRYMDSRAWTPRTQYAFVQLPDTVC